MSPARALQGASDGLAYDYVICGGGTSGCVIAARLAESFPPNGPSILVIEGGPDSKDLELVSRVGGLFEAMGGDLDWNFETVPQKRLNNRVINLARGKFLGGSSGFNGTLCIRGCKDDYDEWRIPGWKGEDVFQAMKKAESFHGKEWFKAANDEHGVDGPLHTEPHDGAPISHLILEAMQEQGMPQIDDMFTTGESAQGCGHVPRTVHQGVRTFAADYLRRHQDRVDIMTSAIVDKVIVEERSGKLTATGVAVVNTSGTSATIKARHEVIISAGAYCSPTILLRSGIGPACELDAHSITCRVDLPGVGKNLQDHLVAFVPYEVTTPNLTNDAHLYHPGGAQASLASYAADKSGVFSAFPFGVFAFARLDEQLGSSPLWANAPKHDNTTAATPPRDPTGRLPTQPHIELMHTELYSGHIHGQHHIMFPTPTNPARHAFEMMTLLFAQQSHGTVTLRSPSPHDPPLIDPAYLSHPLDALALAEGARLAHRVATHSAALAPHLSGLLRPVLPERFANLSASGTQQPEDSTQEREEWIAYVREYSATGHHPAGTCRMGNATTPAEAAEAEEGEGEGVVVDPRLRVLGVTGLRVADVSVMPRLSGAHTQMVAYAVGEKAAEMIVQDWWAAKGRGEEGEEW
ncbi:uncharacterized protein HMPREF1541_10595 [Cyphellophora europaea CBS 101466]|uniref:Glucose-methanol-choline oxidoreductase N-terminal domain-containing protein n=1 Tax=Cyphellophora europaea (strain CBS 101466) TaxID=1220924 RepID=W2S941_CYPE1|nr:uncharacterized protein HMPREF1541_10595 [Cyphellophora europaea CBS 101466]ETN44414.1 hypothetical protein HMPREF1541_10595 [Cyphellophora europaea CBS 101466]